MDQELGNGLAEWFWGPGGPSRGCRPMLAGAEVIWRCDWDGGSASMVAHSHCWHISASCSQEASFPLHVGLFGLLKFPHEMASDFPRWERSKKTRWKVQDLACSSLRSAMAVDHAVGPGSVREGLYKGMDPRKWGRLGTFWMMALRQKLPWRGSIYFSTLWFWSSLATCFDR